MAGLQHVRREGVDVIGPSLPRRKDPSTGAYPARPSVRRVRYAERQNGLDGRTGVLVVQSRSRWFRVPAGVLPVRNGRKAAAV